jgi:hypothetical protein
MDFRKKAEEVYEVMNEAEYQSWPLLKANETAEARKKILASALEQAYREGVEKMLSAARDEQYEALKLLGEDSEWVVRILDLKGSATRLLSKSEEVK